MIEGDRCDTAAFQIDAHPRVWPEDMAPIWKDRLEYLEEKLQGFPCGTPVEKARHAISDQCRVFAENKPGIYRCLLYTSYAGQYVALDADIPLNGDWTPIHSFAGTFDGQGHTVSGMTIGTESAPADASDTPLGFFDILANDARVRNLHLTGVSIYGSAVGQWTRPFVGGIAGGSLSLSLIHI